MFRGQGFQYSTVRVQSTTRPVKPHAIVTAQKTKTGSCDLARPRSSHRRCHCRSYGHFPRHVGIVSTQLYQSYATGPAACYGRFMSKFVILLGGTVHVSDRLRQLVSGARVLAADGGIAHADILGLAPELWLGDFDSTSPELEAKYAHVPRVVFPAAKDMTDGELALNEAYRLGASEVILCGAFGGSRTDHTLLHLTMATAHAAEGRKLVLSSGSEEAHPLVAGVYDFDFADGTLFSIVAFTPLQGLSIDGARWPLKNMELFFGSSLTVSNAVCGNLHVSLHSGKAILIAAPQIA